MGAGKKMVLRKYAPCDNMRKKFNFLIEKIWRNKEYEIIGC